MFDVLLELNKSSDEEDENRSTFPFLGDFFALPFSLSGGGVPRVEMISASFWRQFSCELVLSSPLSNPYFERERNSFKRTKKANCLTIFPKKKKL